MLDHLLYQSKLDSPRFASPIVIPFLYLSTVLVELRQNIMQINYNALTQPELFKIKASQESVFNF